MTTVIAKSDLCQVSSDGSARVRTTPAPVNCLDVFVLGEYFVGTMLSV
jgi:hypothetical protein